MSVDVQIEIGSEPAISLCGLSGASQIQGGDWLRSAGAFSRKLPQDAAGGFTLCGGYQASAPNIHAVHFGLEHYIVGYIGRCDHRQRTSLRQPSAGHRYHRQRSERTICVTGCRTLMVGRTET